MSNAALLATYAPRRYGAGGDPTPAPLPPGAPAPNVAFSPVASGTPTAFAVFLAEERSVFDPSAPTYGPIATAFRAARPAGTDASRGDWIGPGPRVTRTAKIGERFGTFASWVYGWPSAPTPAMVDEVKTRLQTALNAVSSGWQPVAVSAYSAGVNGPIAWWQCPASGVDCAQITRTRDEFPFFAGRLDAQENPLGPTTDATHPTTVLGAVRGAGDSTTTALKWAVGLGAVGVVGWLGVQAYGASRAAKGLR